MGSQRIPIDSKYGFWLVLQPPETISPSMTELQYLFHHIFRQLINSQIFQHPLPSQDVPFYFCALSHLDSCVKQHCSQGMFVLLLILVIQNNYSSYLRHEAPSKPKNWICSRHVSGRYDSTRILIESPIVNENGLIKNMSLQKHTIVGTRVQQWIPGHVGEKELRRHDRWSRKQSFQRSRKQSFQRSHKQSLAFNRQRP